MISATRKDTSMSAGDVDALRQLVQSQADGWNRGDATAYAAKAGADLGFTNIMGRRWVGAEAFLSLHDRILSGIYKGSRIEIEVERITFPGTDVAVAELALRLSGASGMPPGIHADADGVLSTRVLEVFERRAGAWCLVASHNTAVIG